MMDFIPTVMSIRYMGYTTYRFRDIYPFIAEKKPISISDDKPVYKDAGFCYKIFKNPDLVQKVIDNIPTGFYNITSPHLCGIIFEGETPKGYVTQVCDTLHMNPEDILNARHRLLEAYESTNLMLEDFRSENFGKWRGKTVLLDLDAVIEYSPKINSKDIKYNKALEKSYAIRESINKEWL